MRGSSYFLQKSDWTAEVYYTYAFEIFEILQIHSIQPP